MNKYDLVIIKILLKVCDMLSYYSKRIKTTDIYVIKQEIDKLVDDELNKEGE